MRSFGIVEFKLFESDFFLGKLHETRCLTDAEFYLSAFLSASRAVTFALQASLHDHPKFPAWYEQHQDILRKSEVASWSLNARNASQKQGATFIGRGEPAENGQMKFFEKSLVTRNETILEAAGRMLLEATLGDTAQSGPEIDVAAKCKTHLVGLVSVIHRCFQTFGSDIDSQQYYTQENMVRLHKSIEEFENELGLPSGYTAGIPDERRLIALRQYAGETEIDELFGKYLGLDRFGRKSGHAEFATF